MRLAALFLALVLAPFAAGADDRVDLNRADEEVLQHLPGIGPAKARAIVEEREQHGPYASVDDLDRVKGIGASIIVKLKQKAFAGTGTKAPRAPPTRAPDELPIPRPPPQITPELEALDRESPEGKVNVNLATEDELLTLAGMTGAHAKVIVAWRKVKGPFHRVGDLQRVPGLPQKLLQTLVFFVTVRVDANKTTPDELAALGLTRYAAEGLLAQRRKAPIRTHADLSKVAVTQSDRELVRDLVWCPQD